MTNVANPTSAAPASYAQARGAIMQLSTLVSRGDETGAGLDDLQAQANAMLDSLEAQGQPNSANQAAELEGIAQALIDHLPDGWSDRCAAQVLFVVKVHLQQGPPSLRYVADNIASWLDNHKDDPVSFTHCLQVSPPAGIAIERVLNAGAQKQVFVARWPEVTPYKVAFKCFHDSDGVGSGDAFSHPLRGHHPNIIETFPLGSTEDGVEAYLVERLLPTTLSYGWDFGGLGEIVNLIRDIAHALSFVHGYVRIHGDVKLENIGFEDLYILLDFGLCRSEPTDAYAWTPTGNVRALAPELLRGKANTAQSDIWALGSVAFAALTGRPPFFKPDEKQQGFGPAARASALERLAKRADDLSWQQSNDRELTAAVPELALQQLLREMLDSNPERRPTARQVFERCNECLGQFLRPVQTTVQAAPDEELESLLYLRDSGGLQLASRTQRDAIADAAEKIDEKKLGRVHRELLSELNSAVRPS